MKRYKGLGRVFSFTLTQQLRQRGWRTATIAVALACLLIPILSLTVAAQHQKNAAPEQNPVMEEGYTGTKDLFYQLFILIPVHCST